MLALMNYLFYFEWLCVFFVSSYVCVLAVYRLCGKRGFAGLRCFSGILSTVFPPSFFIWALLFFEGGEELFFRCVIHLVNRLINS